MIIHFYQKIKNFTTLLKLYKNYLLNMDYMLQKIIHNINKINKNIFKKYKNKNKSNFINKKNIIIKTIIIHLINSIIFNIKGNKL